VGYVLGLARNARLVRMLGAPLHEAHSEHLATGAPARRFQELCYRTRKSWSWSRRVVGKAEHLPKGANPRFVVTNLPSRRAAAKRLYEQLYCARGEMGVSGQGHLIQSVKVRPRRRDSSLVAWEAPWRESKAVEPSDKVRTLAYRNVPGCNVQ
jgi:hypothetical protein